MRYPLFWGGPTLMPAVAPKYRWDLTSDVVLTSRATVGLPKDRKRGQRPGWIEDVHATRS